MGVNRTHNAVRNKLRFLRSSELDRAFGLDPNSFETFFVCTPPSCVDKCRFSELSGFTETFRSSQNKLVFFRFCTRVDQSAVQASFDVSSTTVFV